MDWILTYFFDASTPPLQGTSLVVFFGITGLFFAASFAARAQVRKLGSGPLAALWRRVSVMGLTMGLMGLALLFFRQYNIFILSARILLYGWLAGGVWWSYELYKRYKNHVPAVQKRLDKEAARTKYLPK